MPSVSPRLLRFRFYDRNPAQLAIPVSQNPGSLIADGMRGSVRRANNGGKAVVDAKPHRSDGAEPRDRAPRFPYLALLAWGLFALAIPRLGQSLNVVDVAAIPLGYFMAAQGSLMAFLVIAILSARRQDRIAGVEDQEG
jgi:putative solute:sodium symporter small subunit